MATTIHHRLFSLRFNRPMFLPVESYPFANLLEQNWQVIRAEYEGLPRESFIQWPERAIYDFGWRAFPLVALQQIVQANAEQCPSTMRLLQAVPDLVNAGFSLFEGRTRVHTHVGYTTSVYRFHLGLRIPKACGLRVGDEVRRWCEGGLLGFDDMIEHSAWNDSEEHRAILLLDVLRPGERMEVTPSAVTAIEEFTAAMRTENQ